MENNSIMSGKELFNQLSKRDYSGSDADMYAQLLKTLHHHLTLSGEEKQFFELLELANDQDKKITVSDPDSEEFTFQSLSLV